MEIKDHPEKSDILTFRARAVAIVSDGSMLDSSGRKFMPVMDWFIAQIKFYAGVDAFPFVIRKETDLQDFFLDLSTSYGNILYLDNK
jgi:malic enzyme